MGYDPRLLDVEWDNEAQHYVVWYDGKFLGTASSHQDAHYLAVDYAARNA